MLAGFCRAAHGAAVWLRHDERWAIIALSCYLPLRSA
jgi:hypothetical protein